MKKCKLWFCDREHYAGGYCQKHYQAFLRHGSALSPYQQDILRANSVVMLGRQIVKATIETEQDESLRSLMKTFLNATQGEGESSFPPCEKCGERPSILTDGKTFIMKVCKCGKQIIPMEEIHGV